MNDDLPELFEMLPPRSAPAQLRERTLAQVEQELGRRSKPRWERVFELSAAAVFLLGLGLNAGEFRQAFGSTSGRRSAADALLARESAKPSPGIAPTRPDDWVALGEVEYARYLAQLASRRNGG